MDNLRRRHIFVVNACPMCLANKETIDHRCKVAQQLWLSLIRWFGCCWVFANSILDLFEHWRVSIGTDIGKEMWRTSLLFCGEFGRNAGLIFWLKA